MKSDTNDNEPWFFETCAACRVSVFVAFHQGTRPDKDESCAVLSLELFEYPTVFVKRTNDINCISAVPISRWESQFLYTQGPSQRKHHDEVNCNESEPNDSPKSSDPDESSSKS
jgi:hypothetical protein